MATTTIRAIVSALHTSIESLTPTTNTGESFVGIDAFRMQGSDDDDIPARIRHRSFHIRVTEQTAVHELSGAASIWNLDLDVALYHHWKREKYLEAETIRAEDLAMIQEQVIYNRPGAPGAGENFGVQHWAFVGTGLGEDSNRWRTDITFSCRARLPQLVTVA